MSEAFRGSLGPNEAGIETGERVSSLEELTPMALMATAIEAFARNQIDLPRAREIVADAAAQLEDLG